MKNLIVFTEAEKQSLVTSRKKESKLGEHIQLIPNLTNIYDEISNLDVSYVIFGVAEDIGVIANNGLSGAYSTWKYVKKILLNVQSNTATHAKKILILGHLDYSEELNTIKALPSNKKKTISKARKLVEHIDADVTHLIHTILKANKIPIVIGGGHNNSYGNLKGGALAFNSKVNAVNLDAHSDFRAEEGRHSGNGFSYAFAEGFLNKYYILGLHENYTSDRIYKTIKKLKTIAFSTYEDIEIRKSTTYKKSLEEALLHMGDEKFGIEVDCDAIANIASSAMTPSGFSVKQARQFVHFFGQQPNAYYL
ncbi:MAG: formimidoylglutamase, partial [Winogradskyella sp.]|nr:formimidoylglutamase [Winogradskyella sp.]